MDCAQRPKKLMRGGAGQQLGVSAQYGIKAKNLIVVLDHTLSRRLRAAEKGKQVLQELLPPILHRVSVTDAGVSMQDCVGWGESATTAISQGIFLLIVPIRKF